MNKDTIFIMHFFNTPALGLSTKNEHDAHITFLAHVLCVEKTLDARLLREVEEIAKNTPEFLVQFGKTDCFGADHDKPVVQLLKNHEGEKLHHNLLLTVTSLGLQLGQPHYAGENFRPHVSLPQGTTPPVGSRVIDTISVVVNFNSKERNLTEVIGNFALEG
jgi:hypothetical protein